MGLLLGCVAYMSSFSVYLILDTPSTCLGLLGDSIGQLYRNEASLG